MLVFGFGPGTRVKPLDVCNRLCRVEAKLPLCPPVADTRQTTGNISAYCGVAAAPR